MPLLMEPRDVVDQLDGLRSVLIVACPICPPMSLAMRTGKPFIEFFRHGIKTPAFEDYVRSIRESLEKRGIRTDVYTTRAPSPLMCLWTKGQRGRLRKRAGTCDAVLVLGCNSATDTVRDALSGRDCRVIQAMRTKAIANATTTFRFPLTVRLDLHPVKKKERESRHHDAGDHASIMEKEPS